MDTHDATRRRVLSAAGTAIVGGLFTTGSAGADVTRGYSTDLRGPTAAGATAYITVEDGEANYSLWVVCIREATHVTFTIDQKPYLEFELEGDVTRGLVTREVVLEGTLTDRKLIDALDDGRAGAVVHTERRPRGELHGPFIPDELGTIDLDDPPRERDEDDADEPTDDDDDTAGRPILITATDAVTDEPVAGAEVRMISADGDPADAVEFTFTTDADGRVDERVEIGNLLLSITADGYVDYSAEMSLESEHHAELQPEAETEEPDEGDQAGEND